MHVLVLTVCCKLKKDKSSAVDEMGDRLATRDMAEKCVSGVGGAVVSLSVGNLGSRV